MRLRLGVAGGPVPRLPADLDEPLARQLAGLGLRVLTTHFQPTPEAVATDASRVRSVLADHGISIVQATGYNPQLTHPDDAVLATELDRLRAAFDTARLLGSEMIISGCGSHHPSHFYGPHPDNHTPATRERLIASLRRVVPWAQDAGVILALECHVTTALDTPSTSTTSSRPSTRRGCAPTSTPSTCSAISSRSGTTPTRCGTCGKPSAPATRSPPTSKTSSPTRGSWFTSPKHPQARVSRPGCVLRGGFPVRRRGRRDRGAPPRRPGPGRHRLRQTSRRAARLYVWLVRTGRATIAKGVTNPSGPRA